MKTTESVLREYIQFEDVNQSETIELLPLTIIDAMDEYANQQERGYSEEEVKIFFKHGILFKEESISTCEEAIEAEFSMLVKQFKKK
jgi:hypothetical protein